MAPADPTNTAAARAPKRRGTILALAVVTLAAAAAILVAPGGRRAVAAIDRCGVDDEIATLARPLPHVAQRILAGGALTIVALGSSSTSGTGATRPENNYPSRLAVTLDGHFPELWVHVINRGVAGEEAGAMLARLDRDVLAEHPDLVIWQVGTNAVLHDTDPTGIGDVVRAGIARIKAAGADVMLMNPQYAPAMLQHEHYREMLRQLDSIAYNEDVPLFPRFAMMRHWAEDGRMPLGAMLSRDRLHMTDVSYDCLARQLGASIDAIARGGA
jgi:lysophospholipase L1-like esterase